MTFALCGEFEVFADVTYGSPLNQSLSTFAIFRPERDPAVPGGVRPDCARPLVLPGPPAAPGDPQQLGLAPRGAGMFSWAKNISKSFI